MTVYAVEGLSVRFGERRVVEGLSFSVAAGECLALVGESGSGKSQACLAPFGLSRGTAEGSAVLMGEQLIGLPEARLRPLRGQGAGFEIGRAHVCTPGTNAHPVCRLLLEKKNTP